VRTVPSTLVASAAVLLLAAGCSRAISSSEETSAASTAASATPAGSTATYTPPAEGTPLVESLVAQRQDDGVVIRGKLLLPETTRLWVELFPVRAVSQDQPLGHAELYLNPGGTFEAGPFKVAGSGQFRVQVTAYFSRAWQQPQVLQAVGMKGTKLPKSALKLDNPGTPGAGGHFEYSTTVTIGS
jgi:hypothetical protein